jgi:spermidine synthase
MEGGGVGGGIEGSMDIRLYIYYRPPAVASIHEMKPRLTLATALLPDGTPLELQEHDGRRSLSVRGQQIAGPATRVVEEECARLACAPFKPVRQPKIWFAGLGIGQAVAAACAALPQKRGNFFVAEPVAELVQWQREHFAEAALLSDARIVIEQDAGPSGLASHAGSLHAIILHTETAPIGANGKSLVENKRWLTAAYDALQPGGLLAIASSRPLASLYRALERTGFTVIEHRVASSTTAKKPRLLPVWLARKGRAES